MSSQQSSLSSCLLYIWDDDFLYEPNHGFLVGPMTRGVPYIKLRWESEMWMTTWCFSRVQNLDGQKLAAQRDCKCSSDHPLVILADKLHPLRTFLSSVQLPEGTKFKPVWSQFIMRSSGMSCYLTIPDISSRNFFSFQQTAVG